MSYGGIDTGPKMFGGGLDSDTLNDEETTRDDIEQFTATNYVGADKDDIESADHAVDFDGVLKGFLYVGKCPCA
jgi:Argonaute siRNA chaperone (ARC) complex subunit Arb1